MHRQKSLPELFLERPYRRTTLSVGPVRTFQVLSEGIQKVIIDELVCRAETRQQLVRKLGNPMVAD